MLLRFLKDYPGIPIIFVYYFFSAFIILPNLNFPFNDDWGYALLTKGFVESGSISFFNWCDPTMIFLVWWGGLWAWLLGFSMTSLHIATVLLAIAGAIALYLILKRFGFSKAISLAGTFLLAVNPIFFFNSFTFMTDVPFLSVSLLALYFYLRNVQNGGRIHLMLVSIFSISAFLIRQTGLGITAALLIIELIRLENDRRQRWIRFFWILILPVIVDIFALVWRMSQPNVHTRIYTWPRLIWSIELAFFMLQYISLFMLPFLLAWMVKIENWKKLFVRVKPVVPIALIILIFTVLAILGRIHPFLRNQITPYGMFGVNEVLMGHRDEVFGTVFWLIVTGLSSIGLGLLLTFLIVSGKQIVSQCNDIIASGWTSCLQRIRLKCTAHIGIVFYIVTFFFIVIPILLLRNAFDRYTITMIPGALIFFLFATKNFRLSRAILFSSIGLMLVFTITISYDTVGWNKLKWSEAQALVKSGIAPTDIDGGFDWYGWHCNKPLQSDSPPDEVSHFMPWYIQHFFWDCDNKFVISFSPLEGFEQIKKIQYHRPFWLKKGYLYVLKRTDVE